jgi:hypothetical protein
MFQYVRCRKSRKSVNLNVILHRGNPIEWHGYCASSVLPDLAPFLFWELKLALKGRRCDSTIQEQSPVLCSPNSAEDGRHIYWGQSIRVIFLVQKWIWLLVCHISWNICLWFDWRALRMQLDMVTVQGAFLDNVGAPEALLQLPEHIKLYPLLYGWVSPC